MDSETLDTTTKSISASNFLNLFTMPEESRLQEIPIGKPVSKRERTEKREAIIDEIFKYYVAEQPKRKRENWKRYLAFIKSRHLTHCKKSVALFKRQPQYIHEVKTVESMRWLLKHIPLEDFYVVLSEVKDRKNRGNNVSSFLGGLWFKNV
jgi:hypothetical protein